MYNYCWSNPIALSDSAGMDPLTQALSEDPTPWDDHEHYGSGGGGASGSTIGSYQAPNGGGGTTSTYQVGAQKVTFGHGGRHLPATDNLSMVESAIVQDIISTRIMGMPVGWYSRILIPFEGHMLVYGAYVKEIDHIHVGTFFYQDTE